VIALVSLSVSPSLVIGGNPVTGTVTLNAPSDTNTTVSLASGSASAVVPGSVVVPAGQTSATFSVTTSAVSAASLASLSASYGGATQTANVTITPVIALVSLSIAPTSVAGGSSSAGVVTLNSAPLTDVVVSLASNSACLAVPASVTVPAGQISATFNVFTNAVSADTMATVTASYGGANKSARLLVWPTTLFDPNSDGKGDILFQNQRTGQLVYWLMDGISMTSIGTTNPGDPGSPDWKMVGTGDFNGDGKPDMLFQNEKTGLLMYWMMNGSTMIASGAISPDNPGSLDWRVVAVADFNSDGKPDILFQNQSTGQLVCWLMNGTKLISYTLLANPGSPAWKVVGAADFNGDGKPDLLLQNQQTGQMIYWLMNGITLITYRYVNSSAPLDWKVVGIIDFNRDGNSDLLFQNQKTGDLMYWLMAGSTMLSAGSLNPSNPGWPDWKAVSPH